MCDEKDAKRHEELAELQEADNELEEARQSYLEAASIYVLQAQLQKKSELIAEANRCSKLSKKVIGEKWNFPELTKQELAVRTLEELNQKPHNHNHKHNED